MENNRVIFIDYLKVIGLLCIILAHICTDATILQIRNFDVPLMVLISGYLAVDSFKRNLKEDRSFLKYYYELIRKYSTVEHEAKSINTTIRAAIILPAI